MTTEEREEIRAHLLNEIAKLKRSVETLTEIMDEEVQSDANDWFTTKDSNASGEINEMALSKAKQRVMVLSNALKEIDSPDFGICIKCKKPIPVARLKAVPSVRRCVECG